jgi:ferric-dicitrate binding protein FerR (iron transport regulator)
MEGRNFKPDSSRCGCLPLASDVTVTNLNDETMQLGLEEGTLRISLYELPSGNAVEVDTPNGAITLQSPGRYRIDTDPDGDRTIVTVNRGSVEVTAEGFSHSVDEGHAFELRGQNPPQATTAPMPPPDGFDEWRRARPASRVCHIREVCEP